MTDSVQLTKPQVIMAGAMVNERARATQALTDCNQAVAEFIDLMRITHGMPPGEYTVAPNGDGLVLSRIEEEEQDNDESDKP